MQIFLKEIAKQILTNFKDNISEQHLIFPNRRSALFFRKYFSELIEKPTFSPRISTINELFKDSTNLIILEPIQLVFKLFEAYRQLKGKKETFDEFFHWGEMLVSDFDDIDKYRVDQTLLFQNLNDLKDIDEKFGGFDKEMLDIIKKFWIHFEFTNPTSEKNDFLSLWDILSKLFKQFNNNLRNEGFAYEGMIMRDLLEKLDSGKQFINKAKTFFHFIGFNALNKCEKDLLLHLKKKNCAYFYWDYDNHYVANNEHEAGFFIRENLKYFGQDLNEKFRYDMLSGAKLSENKFEVIRAPSDVAQAKLIPELLKKMGEVNSQPDKSAIVLADENLLMPVINSIPPEVEDINVTMGYPIYQTPVYSLVNQLLSLQKNAKIGNKQNLNFYYLDVQKVLGHQYIAHSYLTETEAITKSIKNGNLIRIQYSVLHTNEFFSSLFSNHTDYRALNTYLIKTLKVILLQFTSDDDSAYSHHTNYKIQQEYLSIVIKTLQQLEVRFDESNIDFGIDIFAKIIDRLIRKLIVPFAGEPLKGLQVMGILETRALDIENIIVLSTNEGTLPKDSAGNSYIPHNLRMAFGLPTIKHQDSIYAYYFYRLIQRASKVKFVYNSSSTGVKTGEMSRFLIQLKYNPELKTKFTDTKFNIVPAHSPPDFIKRTEHIQKALEEKYIGNLASREISPSALNTWLSCNLKFYYKYIIGLNEISTVSEDIDSLAFGNILHDTVNELYRPWIEKVIYANEIQEILNDRSLVKNIVESSFRKIFTKNTKSTIEGKNLIITSVIEDMVCQILKIDIEYAPFEILTLERKYSKTLIISHIDKEMSIKIEGTIDRVDRKDGVVRILDYKSGNDKLDIDNLDDLTSYNSTSRNSAAFQTILYSWLYDSDIENQIVRPSIYLTRAIFEEKFSDIFKIKKGRFKSFIYDFEDISDSFISKLKCVIEDLFSPEVDFYMTEVKQNCKFCSFADMCGRREPNENF